MVWEITDWIELAQDSGHWRAVCEHGNEPSGSRAIFSRLIFRVV
jgi:hypothetical protein